MPQLHPNNEIVASPHSHRIHFDLNFWFTAELCLNAWFLFELLLRFTAIPRKSDFIRSYMNWLDALVVLPYFVTLTISPQQVKSIGFLRMLRFVRIVRLFRLSRHSRRIKIIAAVASSCKEEMKMLTLCTIVLIVLAGSVIYYTEGRNFGSIPDAFWWAGRWS